MLDQISRHGNIDLQLRLQVIHILMNTTRLRMLVLLLVMRSLGRWVRKRYRTIWFLLPMDESIAQVALDFGGRPWLVWEVDFKRVYRGYAYRYVMHSSNLSDNAKCNINIKAEGDNEHHKIESIFKAFARAIKMAVKRGEEGIPSTKGNF